MLGMFCVWHRLHSYMCFLTLSGQEENTPYYDSHLGLNAIYEFMEAVCLFLLSTCL